jgi:hypothetical protein
VTGPGGGRCPLCGTGHAACGPPSTSVPVDHNIEEAAVSGPLRRYRIVMHGTETVMRLNEADAELFGGEPIDPAPAETEPPAKAQTTAANKARTAKTKDGGGGG